MGGTVFLLCLYFVVPIFITKIVLRASARAIVSAYAIWFGVMLFWGFSSASTFEEALGWPIIMGMFLTIPALPIIVTGLKFAGVK